MEKFVMERSNDRVLTTHTGSLPRPQNVVDLLLDEEEHPGDKTKELDKAARAAISDVVDSQVKVGLDIINDGDQARPDYTSHVKDRLAGYDGPSSPPIVGTGEEGFPELNELLGFLFATTPQNRPTCSGPIGWKNWEAVEEDISRASTLLEKTNTKEIFMTSPSPGQISRYLRNVYYPTEEEYIFALAQTMSREYEAIVEAGFILQLDCPDLALSRHTVFRHLNLTDFRKEIGMHVSALNEAVKNIPSERMRMHVCWSSTLGPHHEDVPLIDILDIVLKGKPGAVSFPGANPRHAHEWKVWKDVNLPDEKIIIPGVIDSTSNFVEHPELVADRIIQYSEMVGKENVIAGVDCGFGTFAGRLQVDRNIVWMKLESLSKGAKLASEKLF